MGGAAERRMRRSDGGCAVAGQAESCGTHGAGAKSRPLGSRLPMPWAREELANFVTDGVREVVRAEVLDPAKSRGKLFGKPRIFNDLLSSQPLCFNLFAELRSDLALASKLVAHFTAGRFSEVVAIEFEHAPSPIERYTGDRSAFDVLLECRSARGAHGFLGIEVKYHENLTGAAASHKPRYEDPHEEGMAFAGLRSLLRLLEGGSQAGAVDRAVAPGPQLHIARNGCPS